MHLYAPNCILIYKNMVLYMYIYAYIGVILLAFESHPTSVKVHPRRSFVSVYSKVSVNLGFLGYFGVVWQVVLGIWCLSYNIKSIFSSNMVYSSIISPMNIAKPP